MHEFSRVAIMKYHRLGGLHSRDAFSHSSRGWKCDIKVSAGLVSSEASPLGLQTVCSHLLTVCSHRLPSVHAHALCLSAGPNFLFL